MKARKENHSASAMQRSLRIIVPVLVALALVAFAGWRMLDPGTRTTFSADFTKTIGLYPGSDVQVLGVPVGEVTAVTPMGDHVRVTMELDHGQQVDAGTAAVIVAPTMVSDRFVQLTKPYDGGTALADGAVIPADRTAVPVEIDQLYRSLTSVGEQLGPDGINSHGALSRFLTVAARNLDGQGTNINTAIREFGKASGALSHSDRDFFATLENLKEFNDMLGANDAGVRHANEQFAAVTSYLAGDRQDMARAVSNLGDAMSVLTRFIRENRSHLKASIDNLRRPTALLAQQKRSLAEAVRVMPLALQNFLNAYNPATGTVDGRGNLNELSVWAKNGLSARTSAGAPPMLLPGVDRGEGGAR